jgi:hypothetical protein
MSTRARDRSYDPGALSEAQSNPQTLETNYPTFFINLVDISQRTTGAYWETEGTVKDLNLTSKSSGVETSAWLSLQ